MKPLFILSLVLLSACAGEREFSSDPLVNERPYRSAFPEDYDGKTPLPLILTLHGSGETGLSQGRNSGLESLVSERQFILLAPDGEILVDDLRGWNIRREAGKGQPDDLAYLLAVLKDAKSRYNVDEDRVYVTGFSNGGFMAYLMACEASEKIAAIAVHAGTLVEDEVVDCTPAEPFAIFHTHGTADENVEFAGGELDFGLGPIQYISAGETISFFKGINGCSDEVDSTEKINGDADVDGKETMVSRFQTCSSGMPIQFWEMEGSEHFISYTSTYVEHELDFLFSHSK